MQSHAMEILALLGIFLALVGSTIDPDGDHAKYSKLTVTVFY